jgi:hypothetical protein
MHIQFRLAQNSTCAGPSGTWTLTKSGSMFTIKNNSCLLYSAVCSCQNPFIRDQRAPTESSTAWSFNYYTCLVRKLVLNGFLPASDSWTWKRDGDCVVNRKLGGRKLKSSAKLSKDDEENKRKLNGVYEGLGVIYIRLPWDTSGRNVKIDFGALAMRSPERVMRIMNELWMNVLKI